MNKDYIIKGEQTLVTDEKGMHCRETTDKIVSVLKIENQIEILKALRDKSSETAESEKYDANHYKSNIFFLTFILIGLPIAVAIFNVMNTPVSLETFTHISKMEAFLNSMRLVESGVGIWSVINLGFIPAYFRHKSEAKKNGQIVDYLNNKIPELEETLNQIKKKMEPVSEVSQEQPTSLKTYNDEFQNNWERRLYLIKELISTRKQLTQEKEERNRQALLEQGYTLSEIDDAAVYASKIMKLEQQSKKSA